MQHDRSHWCSPRSGLGELRRAKRARALDALAVIAAVNGGGQRRVARTRAAHAGRESQPRARLVRASATTCLKSAGAPPT